MTPNQHRCLNVVAGYIAEHGIAPSYRDIAAGLGTASRSMAHAIVGALVAQGELVRTTARTRNLRLPQVDLARVPTEALRAELTRRERIGQPGVNFTPEGSQNG